MSGTALLNIPPEMLEHMKANPSKMAVDPPCFPFLHSDKKELRTHSCDNFFVKLVKSTPTFQRNSIFFGFYREGFSNKRSEGMDCFIGGEKIHFPCAEMYFKLAFGAFHCNIETMKKTWASRDFKECFRSTREMPNYQEEWDNVSPKVMTSACILKLLHGSTFEYCKFLLKHAKECDVKASDIYFFEINDNMVWATNHNSVKSFQECVDKCEEAGNLHEMLNCFTHEGESPFTGQNKMGVALREAFIRVFGEDGDDTTTAEDHLFRLTLSYNIFSTLKTLPTDDPMESPSLKRTLSCESSPTDVQARLKMIMHVDSLIIQSLKSVAPGSELNAKELEYWLWVYAIFIVDLTKKIGENLSEPQFKLLKDFNEEWIFIYHFSYFSHYFKHVYAFQESFSRFQKPELTSFTLEKILDALSKDIALFQRDPHVSLLGTYENWKLFETKRMFEEMEMESVDQFHLVLPFYREYVRNKRMGNHQSASDKVKMFSGYSNLKAFTSLFFRVEELEKAIRDSSKEIDNLTHQLSQASRSMSCRTFSDAA